MTALPSWVQGRDIAIIVSKENAVVEVSSRELKKIFKYEKQYWDRGRRIYLIMREAGSREKETVLKNIYEMTGEKLKKFWLSKLFRGEITSLPKVLGSGKAVKSFVSQVPNSIGYIDASFADGSIKVLRIDGKLPGQAGYALFYE